MIWSLFKSLSIEKPRPSNKLLVSDEKYLQYRKSNQDHEKIPNYKCIMTVIKIILPNTL